MILTSSLVPHTQTQTTLHTTTTMTDKTYSHTVLGVRTGRYSVYTNYLILQYQSHINSQDDDANANTVKQYWQQFKLKLKLQRQRHDGATSLLRRLGHDIANNRQSNEIRSVCLSGAMDANTRSLAHLRKLAAILLHGQQRRDAAPVSHPAAEQNSTGRSTSVSAGVARHSTRHSRLAGHLDGLRQGLGEPALLVFGRHECANEPSQGRGRHVYTGIADAHAFQIVGSAAS
jgi:hypothetical protein